MKEFKAVHMARRMGGILVCALAVLAATLAGPAARAETADQVQEIMRLAGIDKSFDNVGAGIVAGVKQNLGKMETDPSYREKVLAGLEPAAAKAFSPEKMRNEIRLTLERKLASGDYSAILAFYRSPVGKRMTALEAAAQSPDAALQMQAKAGELVERLKNQPEWAEMLKALDSSVGLTESAINIAFNMGRATALGMAAADERTASLGDETIQAIDNALEKARPAMTAQMKQGMILVLAYTYRDASVAELRDYVKFYSTPAGKQLNRAVVEGMNTAFTQAGSDFGHALMKELGKERI